MDKLKGYNHWCLSLLKFIVRIDVTFDESLVLDPHKLFAELSGNKNNEQVDLLVDLTKEKIKRLKLMSQNMQKLKNFLSMKHKQF